MNVFASKPADVSIVKFYRIGEAEQIS